jgi:hypothetical protein
MAFEKFTKTGARIGTPKISIWSSGQIGLNQGAIKRYELDNYRYVILFYDKDNKKIGIKFINDKNEEGAIKIIFRKVGGLSFSGVSFLHYYGIDFSNTRKFDLEHDEKNDLYVFSMEDTL